MADTNSELKGILTKYEDHLKRRGLTYDDLSQSCEDDEMIAKIAREFSTWERTAPYLGLKRSKISEIKRDNAEEQFRKRATLENWQTKFGDEATYINLIKALDEDENVELIDHILDLLKEQKERNDEGVDMDTVKEEDMRFLCGCGKCSLDDFLQNGCPNPWANSAYPLLNIKAMSTRRKLELLARLEQDAMDIKEHFGFMVSCKIMRTLREQYGDDPNTVKELVVFILAQQPFVYMDEQKQVKLKSELYAAETIGDVFEVLVGSSVSWFNHLILGSITKKFTIAEEEYKEYVEVKLAQFLKRSLFEIPKGSFTSEDPEGSGSFILKLAVPPPKDKIKGSVLLPLRRHVAMTLGITIESFELCCYNKGCIELTVSAPAQLVNALFPLDERTLMRLGSMTVGCEGLKITSITSGSSEHNLTKLKVDPAADDSNCDYYSTPLSIVYQLFASLVVEVNRLNPESVVDVIMKVSSHKAIVNISPNFFLANCLDFSVEDITSQLNSYWSFFNFKLLEFVLKASRDARIECKLRHYIQKFESLKLIDLPSLLHPIKNVRGFCSEMLRVRFKAEVTTVEDLISIRDCFASIHQIEPYSLLLRHIDQKRCELSFLIVEGVEATISDKINDYLNVNRLRDVKVTAFTFKQYAKNIPYQGELGITDSEDDSGFVFGGQEEDLSGFAYQSDSSAVFKEQAGSKHENSSTGYHHDHDHPMAITSLPDISSSGQIQGSELSPIQFVQLTPPLGQMSQQSSPFGLTSPPFVMPQLSIPQVFGLSPEDIVKQLIPNISAPIDPTSLEVQSEILETKKLDTEEGEEEWPDLKAEVTPIPTAACQDAVVNKMSKEQKGSISPMSMHVLKGVIQVCKACLTSGYNNLQVAEYFCIWPFQHEGKPEASAAWDREQRCLVEINPLPAISLATSFILCEPSTCQGEACIFPHSELEREAWNDELMKLKKKKFPQTKEMFEKALNVTKESEKDDQQIKKIEQEVNKVDASKEKKADVKTTAKPAVLKTSQAQPQLPNYKEREKWKCSFQERLERTALQNEEYFEPGLSKQNYRDKFYHLLCYEESEHISLLSEKCDGEYDFQFIGQEKDEWGNVIELGCIRGMDGDQIQYASQASEGLFIVHPETWEDVCKADISQSNYYLVKGNFQVTMSRDDAWKFREANLDKSHHGNWYRIYVEFEVKHSYFNTLHRSVISIPQSVIAKILPDKKTTISMKNPFPIMNIRPECPLKNLSVDEHGQFSALEAILQKPSSVPIIVSGPFGSGKTRTLARAAFEFGKYALRQNIKTRILICAHHSKTIETYKYFLGSAFCKQNGIKIIQIVRKRRFEQYYIPNVLSKNLSDFRRDISRGSYVKDRCIIVIATYMMSINVGDILSSRNCVLTHILLDEAAQVREPEAIASLCAANTSTKVVIAGDTKQVGPYVVVLGSEARKHGLKKSLLERLEEHYYKEGPPLTQYILQLGINYRCHPMLTSLLSSVMYGYDIKSGTASKSVHPASPDCPCVFHYYDVKRITSKYPFENLMEDEADAVISQLWKYFEIFPPSRQRRGFAYKDVCIISSNRNQLNLIKERLEGTRFKDVTLLPSYSIQGHEFQAVFLSTLEHLNTDGVISNPTKSLVTPRIFNTVLSRSKSLVVAVGNPFSLLKSEETYKHPEKCWKSYLKLCLERKTLTFAENIIESSGKITGELGKIVGLTLQSALPVFRQKSVSDPGPQKNDSTKTLLTPHPNIASPPHRSSSVQSSGQHKQETKKHQHDKTVPPHRLQREITYPVLSGTPIHLQTDTRTSKTHQRMKSQGSAQEKQQAHYGRSISYQSTSHSHYDSQPRTSKTYPAEQERFLPAKTSMADFLPKDIESLAASKRTQKKKKKKK